MRLKGLAVLAAVALFFAAAVPVFAQSLADLAKREEERRRKIAEPAKVYTNKDLASGQAPSAPPASATPAAPAAASDAAKDTEPAAKD
jgi:hypothetical protein